MSVLTIPVSPRRQASADINPRLRRRTAKFSASLSAPREHLAQSGFRPRSAYYSVIAGAVSRLPNNTRDARLALYDRAETALTAELLRHPDISDQQVADERLALEKAFLKIEGDARRKETSGRSRANRPWPFATFFGLFARGNVSPQDAVSRSRAGARRQGPGRPR
jgi:hypothetical protein